MAAPAAAGRIGVGVFLAQLADPAGCLADASAFDAAGADVLWLDLRAIPEVDPFVLTGAVAAVTFRALVVADLPVAERDPRAFLTIGRLSRDRLRIVADEGSPSDETLPGVFRRMPREHNTYEHTDTSGTRRWVAVPVPDGRAAWRATLTDAAEHDFHGVLVPANSRLLDLLRNPDEEVDRRDLQLAQG